MNILSKPSFIVGGAALEMALKTRIDRYCKAQFTSTQRSYSLHVCMQAFGKALQSIVNILCENAGLDASSILSELESIHGQLNDNHYFGVDIDRGCAGDLFKKYVFEPTIVKRNALMCACEAACLILSIDYVIKMPQEETEEQRSSRLAKEYRERQIAQRKWKEAIAAQRKELS